jgi:hypothetical protein
MGTPLVAPWRDLRDALRYEAEDAVDVVVHHDERIEHNIPSKRLRSMPFVPDDVTRARTMHNAVVDRAEETSTSVRAHRHKVGRMRSIVDAWMAEAVLALRNFRTAHGDIMR